MITSVFNKNTKIMGRPLKEVKQDKRIVTYLTEEENNLLRDKAEENMISIAALSRKILVKGLKNL